MIAYRFGSVSDASFGVVASLTALAVAYLGGITSVSGAVTSGIVATSGVAFFASSELFDAFGTWEVYVGGLLLILTAILNPEGIAGGIRTSAARARAKKAEKARVQESARIAVTESVPA
jgi:branched-chain amino acid transport system permease protein